VTAKHLLEGVMQSIGARNHNQASVLLELDPATVSRLGKGKQTGLNMATVDHIQRKSSVPFELLFDWYRLPEGATLGPLRSRPAPETISRASAPTAAP
jgi:hypothetical protein